MSDEVIICIKKEAGMRVVADKSDRSMVEKLSDEIAHIHAFSRAYLDKRDNGQDSEGRILPMGDPDYWQILPYLSVEHDGKPFLYRRTKKVGESRLAGNTSIGVGGHVAIDDLDVDCDVGFDVPAFSSKDDLRYVIMTSIEREIEEELGVRIDAEEAQDICFIVDHSNDVGKLHLGLGMKVSVDSPVSCAEDELESIGHLSVEELKAMDGHENWTKIMLGM